MARWAPARRDVLDALADEILHNYRRGRAIVAVDGPPGTEPARFAADLAEALRRADHDAFAADLGDFRRPRAEREALGVDARTRYERSYDEELLRRVLVEPFRLAGSTGFVLEAFDAARDVPYESRWTTGPADAVLVVGGEFLLRASLRGIWSTSVLLVADGSGAVDPAWALYEDDAGPRTRTVATVDVTDQDHPRRRFADSC